MQAPMNDPTDGTPNVDALRALAYHDADRGASPAVHARLLAEVRSIARARRVAHIKSYSYAITLAILVTLPVWKMATRQPPVVPVEELTTEFFPLRYAHVPISNGHLVRMEVPETAMESFGLKLADDHATPVLADVLIGEDGVARAVRFVVNTSEETLR
jgi:hypothetical protein